MNKKAIIVGATGLVGRTLTDQLTKADHIKSIVTLTRRPFVEFHINRTIFF